MILSYLKKLNYIIYLNYDFSFIDTPKLILTNFEIQSIQNQLF